MTKIWTFCALLILFSCQKKTDTVADMDKKPNVVFFFIDDMGWKDLEAYGAKLYETPNIDNLAEQGILFKQAYTSAPICSPARASVLTGKHPVRLGMWNHFHTIPKGEKILPQYLKREGYQTWHVGKWHMGNYEDQTMPQDLGFDVNIGGHISWAPGSYFWPYGVDENGKCIKERRCVPGLRDGGFEGEYLTDRLTDEALKLIENRDKNAPFYLNFWHYAVHSKQEGKPELVEKYNLKINEMDIDSVFRLDPKTGSHLVASEINAKYAAMIQSVDESVGRVVKKMKEIGEFENTLFVFYSDNGVTTDNAPCVPLNGGKNSTYEAGVRVPAFMVWNGKIQKAKVYNGAVYLPDVFETIAEATKMSSIPSTDGLSLLPLATNNIELPKRKFMWYFPDTRTHWAQRANAAIYEEESGIKYISFFNGDEDEVYNIHQDLAEEHNLYSIVTAKKYQHLKQELHAFIKEHYKNLQLPPEKFKDIIETKIGYKNDN